MRQDLAELKKILELVQRPKIKDFLTIEIRRQETKLADLIEKEDVSKKDEKIAKTNVAQIKTYDYVIRNYCKGNLHVLSKLRNTWGGNTGVFFSKKNRTDSNFSKIVSKRNSYELKIKGR